MLVLLLLILMLFVGIYKLIAISSIKVVAFAVDFFLVFFYTIYFLHGLVSVKISSGNVVCFWDVVLGIITIGIYGFIILTIHHLFPKISKILNYIISVIGVSVVIPLALSFSTAVVNIFNSNFKPTDRIQLLNNVTADKIVYIVIAIMIAIPVWNVRMEKLNS